MPEFKCGACGGEFDEPTPKWNDKSHMNYNNLPTSYHCPHCGHTMSPEFARQRNAKRCGCNATMDHDGYEVCSSCGNKMGYNVNGVNETHAIPSKEDVEKMGEYEEYQNS